MRTGLTEGLFQKRGATVIVGMSMSDPNLRRLLYSRLGRIKDGSHLHSCFMQRSDLDSTSGYVSEFWKLLGVDLLPYTRHSELPGLIRQIQWGGNSGEDAPNWFSSAVSFTGIKLVEGNEQAWRDYVVRLFETLHRQIDPHVPHAAQERIRLTFFAPASIGGTIEPKIYELASVDMSGRF